MIYVIFTCNYIAVFKKNNYNRTKGLYIPKRYLRIEYLKLQPQSTQTTTKIPESHL